MINRRAACVLCGLALSLAACGPKTEESSELSADIPMNSSRTAKQLLTGFYNVENGSWRWTAKNFSVALGVPAGASTKGGKLTFRFAFPDSAAQSLHSVTVTAKIKNSAFAPETYSKSGAQVYTRDIPASDLTSSPVRIDFSLDKATPPGPVDIRELGLVANDISLTSK